MQSGGAESVAEQQRVEYQRNRAAVCEPGDRAHSGSEGSAGEGRSGDRMDAEEHSDHVRGCAENTHVGRKESSEMEMK